MTTIIHKYTRFAVEIYKIVGVCEYSNMNLIDNPQMCSIRETEYPTYHI